MTVESDVAGGVETWSVPVEEMLAHWDPFAAWDSDPLSHEDVALAVQDGLFSDKPFDTTRHETREDEREYHRRRIAWLVMNRVDTPIEIDIGAPSLGWTPTRPPFDFIDGNHRLCAAAVRQDRRILVTYSGECDAFPALFPGAVLVTPPAPLPPQAEAARDADKPLVFDIDVSTIGITAHCIVRWLERVHGLDLTTVRREIDAQPGSAKQPEKRMVALLEQQGIDFDPIRASILRDIGSGSATIVTMARRRTGRARMVRDWLVTTDVGHAYVVSTDDGGRSYAPTVLDAEMSKKPRGSDGRRSRD